jgi:hypothetical protein
VTPSGFTPFAPWWGHTHIQVFDTVERGPRGNRLLREVAWFTKIALFHANLVGHVV